MNQVVNGKMETLSHLYTHVGWSRMQMVPKANRDNPKSTQRRDWGGKGKDFEKAIILEAILGIILRIIGWPIQEEGIPA